MQYRLISMNIIIPLCGIGKRFQEAGYVLPKPLIDVMGKSMIENVLDHLDASEDDNIFIIYHHSLEEYGFSTYIKTYNPRIKLMPQKPFFMVFSTFNNIIYLPHYKLF